MAFFKRREGTRGLYPRQGIHYYGVGGDPGEQEKGARVDKATVSHVISLLNSVARADQSLGVGILDYHLSLPDSSYPNTLLDTIVPLSRLMHDPELASEALETQVEIASTIAKMTSLANPLDLRFQEMLVPLIQALKRRDDLTGHAEELLVALGMSKKQITNMYFAFRQPVDSMEHSLAIEWLIRHGSPPAVLVLIDFLNEPEFPTANGALQWIVDMAQRINKTQDPADMNLDFEMMYTGPLLDVYLPPKERLAGANPNLIQFLHCLATLLVTLDHGAQQHRMREQMDFLQSNAEGNLQQILDLCHTGESIDAFFRALARGSQLSRKRFGEQDQHLKQVVLNLALAADDRVKALGVETRYL